MCLVALAMFMASQSARAEYVKLTALDGWNAWSGGGEEFTSLVDADPNSKWGTWFQPNNVNGYEDERIAYIIVKAAKAVVPTTYFLITGNDTGSAPNRNWKEWKIYGGNFESDADAVRNGEGWTLVDHHTADDEPLPATNFGYKNYPFSEGETAAFQYFWIEILDAVGYSGDDNDTYLQMSEWGLGTYSEFQTYLDNLPKPDTNIDEPVVYYVLEGTKMTGSESLPLLFDGKTSTKWCTGFTEKSEGSTTNGAYFIVKASRPMLPTYYILTTANDTDPYSDRNWKQWQIYGMNAESADDVKRDSEGWVALDKKYNVGSDQLPVANFTPAYFGLSEANETEYRYFKVEIDKIVGGGTMQMSEFNLGDQYTFVMDHNSLSQSAEDSYDPDLFAEKALLDQLGALVAEIKALTEPTLLGVLSSQLTKLTNDITASAKDYAQLLTVCNQALLTLDSNTMTEEGAAYIASWTSETDVIAPDADFPVGNIAYIKANRQITGEQAAEEARRINTYLFNNSDSGEAINTAYQFICGTSDNWNDGAVQQLIDGDKEGTKWGTATNGARYIVFKAEKPIQPTYYGLVTGWDTGTYTFRNWKNWKIWGANFATAPNPQDPNFDPAAVKESTEWVLIDEKENVGPDILKTTSLFESYIYLSIGCAVPYEYFKIEVYHEGQMQMNEFTFYNNTNLKEYRQEFVNEFSDYDPADRPAYIELINAFRAKYEELKTTTYAPDVMRIKNEMVDLQKQIEKSADKYDEYEDLYSELCSLGAPSEGLEAWFDGYTSENIAPNNVYRRGTHDYIMESLTLDNDALGKIGKFETSYEYNDDGTYKKDSRKVTETLPSGEIGYLQNMINAANDGVYILIEGHTVGQFGDGFYGHLIDGVALNDSVYDEVTKKKEVSLATKWGGNADENGDTYVIFRTLNKTNPFFYTLTTGNDAERFPERNWGTWYIYGGNFEGDVDATKDADGWVLIDAKENVQQDRLHPVNAQPSYFGFSTETTEEYMYYKVVVTKAYDGTAIQMNELHFGTEEEFDEIKSQYTTAAYSFDYDVLAQQSLIEEYVATIPEIDECLNMEALFRVNYKLETLRDAITSSNALYTELANKTEENKAYLANNNITESEALTLFTNYLNGDETEGPSDLYPNGCPAYIIEEHVLNDSIISAELEFMESLKVAATAAGYTAGMDISCMIVNRTFAKAGAMLKNEKEEDLGREAEGWDGYIYRTAKAKGDIYAAEFVNVNKVFDINQTLTNLKNGFYKLTLNAVSRANGDEKMLSYNYSAMAYANDIYTYVPVIREDAALDSVSSWQGYVADRKIYSADSTETFGWGVWGCEGAAHAFDQGRYAITLVAQVTDGTLTFGVKNPGTTLGNEWTAAGNFGLVYLGEADAADNGVADALAEAANYNAARIITMTEAYEPYAWDTEEYPEAPNFGEAQRRTLIANSRVATYAAEKLIGETMLSVYETKKAYVDMVDAQTKVYDKWTNNASVPDMEAAIEKVQNNLEQGGYDDAAAVMAAKAKLYADFPDYLEIKENGSVRCSWEMTGDFLYEITTTGKNPYIQVNKLYEALESDEVILAFDYVAEQDLEGGKIAYMVPEWDPNPEVLLPTLPATEEFTTIYINVTNGIKTHKFGSDINHGIQWNFAANATADDSFVLSARKFRFMTKAQMKAEGGRTVNYGDVNSDNIISIADAVSVLNNMAGEDVIGDCDVNGDGIVSIADFVTVLNIMAGE